MGLKEVAEAAPAHGFVQGGGADLDFFEVKINIRRQIPSMPDVKVCGV